MAIHLECDREGEWVVARMSGAGAIREVTDLIPAILQECRRFGSKTLLVDLTGVEVPVSTTGRFELGERAALFAREGILLAAVARPDLVDPARFGELVARNRGLTLRVFTDPQEARIWLRGQDAGR